jgi:3D (Asp-Asp-Asp) domain-containing protein
MKTLIYVVVLLISLIPTKANMLLKQYKPEKPKEEVPDFIRVKATMYTVSGTQTDSTPLVTASGFKLHPSNPRKHRIIAVSRDLKRKFRFGEKVRIEGVGKYSGVYTVRDVMNARWTKKIDILINPEDKAISYNKARLYRL